ncbi:MAG TPA: thioredoxin family protein [Candidatus Krumholzibacteria bacterium]|nr:thioredoxin family protein [Candidatus Krumholzibacteria bacterium]
MRIAILGTGCPKCEKLMAETRAAADELGLVYDLVKVSKVSEIMGYGVMLTPALVVDGQVKVSGRVPSRDELKAMLG